jgi:hypothetical protein
VLALWMNLWITLNVIHHTPIDQRKHCPLLVEERKLDREGK